MIANVLTREREREREREIERERGRERQRERERARERVQAMIETWAVIMRGKMGEREGEKERGREKERARGRHKGRYKGNTQRPAATHTTYVGGYRRIVGYTRQKRSTKRPVYRSAVLLMNGDTSRPFKQSPIRSATLGSRRCHRNKAR